MENVFDIQPKGDRNKTAAMFGLLLGIFYIIVTTISYMQIESLVRFWIVKLLGFVLFLVVLGILATRIKKANGGFLSFKETFSAIFIMVLVSGVLYFIYNYVYIDYIDKDYLIKMKTSTLKWMEEMKTPDAQLDKTADQFDKQIEESKHFSLKNNVLSLLGIILTDSLFGLIVAAIVKKNKPIFD